MAVNLAGAILGTPVTFQPQDCGKKMQQVRNSYARQQHNPQRKEMGKGFEMAFSILEKNRFDARAAVAMFEKQLLVLLEGSKEFICTGFVAGMLFCRDTVAATRNALMECMEHAYACVQEAFAHLQLFTDEQQNSEVALSAAKVQMQH